MLHVALVCFAVGLQNDAAPPNTPITHVSNLNTWVSDAIPTEAGRGDTVEIGVTGLKDYIEFVQEKRADSASLYTEWALVPYFNGVPLRGVYPLSSRVLQGPPDTTYLTFRLLRTVDSREAWDRLLNSPAIRRKVSLSVGFENEEPVVSIYRPDEDKDVFRILVIRPRELVAGGLILLAALIIFFHFARTSDLIRDRDAVLTPNERAPFSLGRTQMAIWFFLAISAFFYLWMLTGDKDTIPTSILGLLGISAGTALGSAIIDAGQQTPAEKELTQATQISVQQRLTALKKERREIRSEMRSALIPKEGRQSLLTRAGEIDLELKKLNRTSFRQFLLDLLSDRGVISFHRFQIFVWTLVLAVIFVKEVISDVKMPDFSNNLLALMGISAGTYLGFKLPQKAAG
jgi:hypothetical protein